jgi:uncharacterized membrane protein SirB2
MAAPLRFLSYSIDTILLTAALMLLTILPHAVFANGWLAVKLALLVVYVALGSFALKARAQSGAAAHLLRAGLAGVWLHADGGSQPPATRRISALVS